MKVLEIAGDWNQKLAGKVYADKRRNDLANLIASGDKVLVKNSKSSGKLTFNFGAEPYTVQTKEGQELSLNSAQGAVHWRNCYCSFIKPTCRCLRKTSETTEPRRRRRPNRTIRMPAKINSFKKTVEAVKEENVLRLLRLFMNLQTIDCV